MRRDDSRRSFLLGTTGLVGWAAGRAVSSGELAHWKFECDRGIATDLVTSIEDVISSRSAVECRPGVKGNALRLDGYSVWITRDGKRAPAIRGEFTIQLWVALESYPVSDAAFIDQRDGQTTAYFFGIDKYGFVRFEIFVNGVWRRCVSAKPVPRFEWIHLGASFDGSGVMALYQNGDKISAATGAVGQVRGATDTDLLVGKADDCPYVEGVFPTGVLNGLVEELVIHGRALSAGEIGKAPVRMLRNAQLDLAVPANEFRYDQHRPTYHAMPPRAWTNEPHGLIRFRGEYHLFYQKNANGPYWGQINWGHMVSRDLLRWSHLTPALSPEPGLDAAGCWSGSVIEHEDRLAIVYTAGDAQKKPSICLATSDDGVAFLKSQHNPIIASSPRELNHPDFRDPFVWVEGNSFYMLIGSGIPNVGGTALVYKSSNLIEWKFVGQLLQGRKEDSGTFWEMPVFFSLGEKHILIVTEVPGRSSYWIGLWKDERFYPEQDAPRRLEVLNHFLSPTPYRDERGRAIVIGIIPETRSPRERWKAGWAHLYSLPRVLSLDAGGSLVQQPLPELDALRGETFRLNETRIEADGTKYLANVRGKALEIVATLARGDSRRTGFRLRRTPDGEEETLLYYDWADATLTLDRSRSSKNPEVKRHVETGRFQLGRDEPLRVHLFLDHSVLEVFLNGRGTLSSRIYPTREDSDEIDVFSEEGTSLLERLEVWAMAGKAD